MTSLLKRAKDHTLDGTRKMQCREIDVPCMNKLIEDFDSKLLLCREPISNHKKRKISLNHSDKERIEELEKKTEKLEEEIHKLRQIIIVNKISTNDDRYWDAVVN